VQLVKTARPPTIAAKSTTKRTEGVGSDQRRVDLNGCMKPSYILVSIAYFSFADPCRTSGPASDENPCSFRALFRFSPCTAPLQQHFFSDGFQQCLGLFPCLDGFAIDDPAVPEDHCQKGCARYRRRITIATG
jgi:hypothetical protein